ncbi:MAG TPA: sigma factor [Solirubrobacteraceae bacterium]|jgi:RNA polymerase sigma-70 factor (ECF subfamily)|nr:sigma factor [Solirubrobacteraceae bacterium]
MNTPHGRDPRDAFEDLYRSTCDALLRYLVHRCRDAEEAADLLAETYLTAWGKLDAVPDGEAAQLSLFGVARNLLLRSARRRRVADALIERLAEGTRAAQATGEALSRSAIRATE